MRTPWQGGLRSGESLKKVRLSKQRPRGAASGAGGGAGIGAAADAGAGDGGDDQEARWHRFHDSIHKAQRDTSHPTETLKFIAIALSALGEVLQEAMRRSQRPS